MKTQSENLFIRKLEHKDVESFFSIYSDIHAMKFRETPPTLSLEEARQSIEKAHREFAEKTAFRFAVIDKKTDALMGTFVYRPKDLETVEIGYSLGKNYWNKGYASELVCIMLTYLRKKGFRQIQAWTAQDNTASQRVLIKNHFVLADENVTNNKLLFQHSNLNEFENTVNILGCGWLGFPLAVHFKNLGICVKASTTTETKLALIEEAGISPYCINLAEENLNESLINDFLCGCDTLIIAIPPRVKDAAMPYSHQLERLIPLLCDSAVKRVIFMSSTSVYGCQPNLITEKTATDPTTTSGCEIVAAENLFRTEGLWKTTILRLGGLFGPLRHPVTFLAQKSEFENPDLSVNMVHLNDVIAFTTQLVFQNQKEADAVFNLVAPYEQTRKEFYSQAATIRGLKLPPDGSTNWSLEKMVSGDFIIEKTGIHYLF
ncbi:GNAT family N-acetyltransferase [Flavobacterium sp. NKUCC04_CG]|uniref:GNAT family N-acetyltransferase n=1 Tax=Flavobacterium sp. NKUCC04_CG TaxID=2842121 RepID=UPI001C5B691B|nr:GNAT family N-acetyltransferase [Flavobacterium sp. NKUCC04_CG]MBW3518765.1 GNAT family N-acetyltransferase [Flavobacterium sp. NKUCC04_CG]